jgi:DNA modification methylase
MELKIEYIAVEDLKPYEKNNKKHEDFDIGEIAKSISKYEMIDPVGIWGKDNTIVEGHGRVLACKQLGIDKVPCIRLDHLTDEQRREYAIVHNKSSELALYDFDNLADELAELDLSDFDFDFGIDTDAEEETEIVEDEAPEVDEENEPITKLDDIWQLGRHRLMCGDSTDKETVELLMNGNKADIEFTSPPYNAGASEKLSGNTHTTDSKYLSNNDDLDNYDELLFKSTENGILFSKYAIINIQMLAGNKLVFCDYLHKFKDKLCDIAIWRKTTTAPAMAERVMNSQFEFVLFFSQENNSRAVGTNNFRGTVSNVFDCSPQRKNEFSNIHAATFSVEFVSNYINNFSNKNDSVLDLFGGTGTTLVACEQLDRTCYMMELDPKYCDVIIKRWETLTGEKAVKIN